HLRAGGGQHEVTGQGAHLAVEAVKVDHVGVAGVGAGLFDDVGALVDGSVEDVGVAAAGADEGVVARAAGDDVVAATADVALDLEPRSLGHGGEGGGRPA